MEKGSSLVDVLIFTFVIIFIILPLFSFVIEMGIIINKSGIIRDAVDLANISAYNAINCNDLSKNQVIISQSRLDKVYRKILAQNLKLDKSLNPKYDSIACSQVSIEELVIYNSGFPLTCERGVEITRPSIHSCIVVPVKPSLFAGMIMKISGKEHMELKLHVDTEIPKNN